jgi:hypothetical protein
MNVMTIPQDQNKQYRLIRIAVISALVFSMQGPLSSPEAEANIASDAFGAISTGIAFDLGYRACSYACAAAAVGTVTAVNSYAPVVAQKTVEYVKPGIISMFTNWASTYFVP